MTSQSGPISAIRNASIVTFKAWVNANATLMQKPLSYFPVLNSVTNMALSVINQDYTGDINMIMPPRFWRPAKLLGTLTVDEIRELMDLGERITWPKIEMVRTQTKISLTLDRILAEFDRELVTDYEIVEANVEPVRKRA
jgi:NTE family protein